MVGFIARKEMQVFHLYGQLCIYRDKEDVQHGKTGFMGQNWSHEFELYGICRALGLSIEREPAGTWKFSILG